MKLVVIVTEKPREGKVCKASNARRANIFCDFAFIICLALGSAPLALSQTPQGFNYQALAMTSVGEPIRSQALPVRITIQSDSLGGTIFWYEEHAGVTTNTAGLFTIIVGKGAKISGTATTFADIDWTVTPKFIKTEINNGTWQSMGSSRLWSVPYAMAAGSLTGSLPRIDVTGASGDSRIGGHLLGLPNIEVNNYGTGNRYAFIDFHGDDTYLDYGLRLIRNNTGPDAYSRLHHRGLGQLELMTQEAAPIDFYTSSVHVMRISATGNVGIKTKTPLYSLDVNGEITSRSSNAFRMRASTYSSFLRNDNTNLYLMLTNNGDPDGSWNTLRPIVVGLSSGNLSLGNGALNVIHGGNVGVGATNPTSKMVVQPPATWSDDVPLFEVRNKKGVPVFAVYNYGVRILVDHTYSKAVKGGFAIGGFDESKAGETINLMTVSPDSIRFNINNSGAKAVKGGFAIGGFDESKAPINEDFMYITPQGSAVGEYNTFIGYQTGFSNLSTGVRNTFMGHQAGYKNTSADHNVFIGTSAGFATTTGGYNVYIGSGAGDANTNGTNNVILGTNSGGTGTSFSFSTFVGAGAGLVNSSDYNTFVGCWSGNQNTTGAGNTYLGSFSGFVNTGSYNVLIGQSAGEALVGSGNVCIGYQAAKNETMSNKLYIANSSASIPLIYGDFSSGRVGLGTITPNEKFHVLENSKSGAYAARVAHTGNSYSYHGLRIQAGANSSSSSTTYMVSFSDGDNTAIGSISLRNATIYFNQTSDKRLKTNITETKVAGIGTVNQLPVVDFAFRESPDQFHTGFIAQDVEKVLPEAVSENEDGFLQLSMPTLIPVLTKAIQEQQLIIESLEERLSIQQTELETLRTEMESIKALLLKEAK
ncbi:MAG: tail fiber domain-containing protein [Bacteroidales bacterium]|nr:tail fiber domain-containing protein [Bacteroidales bacterium]